MENNENRTQNEELNYRAAYYFLFNKITDTINELNAMTENMKSVQRAAEEICIEPTGETT